MTPLDFTEPGFRGLMTVATGTIGGLGAPFFDVAIPASHSVVFHLTISNLQAPAGKIAMAWSADAGKTSSTTLQTNDTYAVGGASRLVRAPYNRSVA